MNFKTLTIILGVVVASIILGTGVISGDTFGKVAAIKATHQPDAELKSDAFVSQGSMTPHNPLQKPPFKS